MAKNWVWGLAPRFWPLLQGFGALPQGSGALPQNFGALLQGSGTLLRVSGALPYLALGFWGLASNFWGVALSISYPAKGPIGPGNHGKVWARGPNFDYFKNFIILYLFALMWIFHCFLCVFCLSKSKV